LPAIARLLQVGGGERTSLMFGLGMNNNGTGLVLASMALADHPTAMLPIIFYNLVQHLVAGGVDRLVVSERPTAPAAPRARADAARPSAVSKAAS